MDYIDTLIDWNDEEEILRVLNERISEIAEDPCVTPYQCWMLLNCVKEAMIKTAYSSAIKYIAGGNNGAKACVSRAEGYRFLYDLYYDCMIRQGDPTMEEDDFRGYDGKVEITIFMGEEKEVFDSVELFVSYMMSTDNWLKPEKFLIQWKEAGMRSAAFFDSTDTDRW